MVYLYNETTAIKIHVCEDQNVQNWLWPNVKWKGKYLVLSLRGPPPSHAHASTRTRKHTHTGLRKSADIKFLEEIHSSTDSGYLVLTEIVDACSFLLYTFLYVWIFIYRHFVIMWKHSRIYCFLKNCHLIRENVFLKISWALRDTT